METSNYYLDLEHRLSCARILSAKPAEKFDVFLKDEANRSAPSVIGQAMLRADGTKLDVFFEGQHSHVHENDLSEVRAKAQDTLDRPKR
jgi:hypothetical protein